jgi:hypothetical protein
VDLRRQHRSHPDRRGKVSAFRYDAFNRPTFAGFGTTGEPGSEQYESTIDYT